MSRFTGRRKTWYVLLSMKPRNLHHVPQATGKSLLPNMCDKLLGEFSPDARLSDTDLHDMVWGSGTVLGAGLDSVRAFISVNLRVDLSDSVNLDRVLRPSFHSCSPCFCIRKCNRRHRRSWTMLSEKIAYRRLTIDHTFHTLEVYSLRLLDGRRCFHSVRYFNLVTDMMNDNPQVSHTPRPRTTSMKGCSFLRDRILSLTFGGWLMDCIRHC